MNKNPKQATRIISYMQDNGGITALEASRDLGCLRLGARIFELKEHGYDIRSEFTEVENRYGEKMPSKKILVRRYRMSYIPDCRTDNDYNEKYLNEKDREYLDGFDWCVKTVLEPFVDNINIYRGEFDIEGAPLNLEWFLQNNKKVAEKLRECMVHFSEMERNTLITAMIECMDEEEYKEIKARVDGAEK